MLRSACGNRCRAASKLTASCGRPWEPSFDPVAGAPTPGQRESGDGVNAGTIPRTPWFYGWTIVGVCVVFQILTIGMYAAFSFFVRPWTEEFHASRADILWAIALAHVGKMIGGMVFGPMMDRFPIRNIIAAGLGAMALGFAALPFATAVAQVTAIFALSAGLGMSMAGPLAGQTLAAKWFRARRGLALGIVPLGSLLSGFVLVPITIALMQNFGWRGTFFAFAAMFAVMIPVVLLLVCNSPEDAGVAPEREGPDAPAASAAPTGRGLTIGAILSDRNFWIAGLAFFGPSFTIGALISNLEPLAHDLGFATSSAGIVAQLISILGVVGILWGRLSDRFDHRALVLCSICLQVVGYVMILREPSYIRLLLGAALIASGMSGFYPLLSSIIGRCFGPQNFGRVLGYVLTFYVTGAVASPLAGWVRDRFGTYDPFFITTTVVIGLFGSLIVLLRRPATPAPEFATTQIPAP